MRTFDGPAGTLLSCPAISTTAARSWASTAIDARPPRPRVPAGQGRRADPFTPINVPGAPSTFAFGLNDRGQITGTYNNPNAAPSPQPATTPAMGRMT